MLVVSEFKLYITAAVSFQWNKSKLILALQA